MRHRPRRLPKSNEQFVLQPRARLSLVGTFEPNPGLLYSENRNREDHVCMVVLKLGDQGSISRYGEIYVLLRAPEPEIRCRPVLFANLSAGQRLLDAVAAFELVKANQIIIWNNHQGNKGVTVLVQSASLNAQKNGFCVAANVQYRCKGYRLNAPSSASRRSPIDVSPFKRLAFRPEC